jgi:response regulator RpfG family c-di-GMP phosphodiesterase
MSGKIHSKEVECMNCEVRDSEKVMGSLKRTDTPILKVGADIVQFHQTA